MERKTFLGLFALTIVGLLGVSGIAAAHGAFGFTQSLTDADLKEIRDQHNAMGQAIQNDDFETWKSLQEERIAQMQSELTQENFDALVERNQKMQEFQDAMQTAKETGDYTEVDALRQQLQDEYGFMMDGPGYGFGHGFAHGGMMDAMMPSSE